MWWIINSSSMVFHHWMYMVIHHPQNNASSFGQSWVGTMYDARTRTNPMAANLLASGRRPNLHDLEPCHHTLFALVARLGPG